MYRYVMITGYGANMTRMVTIHIRGANPCESRNAYDVMVATLHTQLYFIQPFN